MTEKGHLLDEKTTGNNKDYHGAELANNLVASA